MSRFKVVDEYCRPFTKGDIVEIYKDGGVSPRKCPRLICKRTGVIHCIMRYKIKEFIPKNVIGGDIL